MFTIDNLHHYVDSTQHRQQRRFLTKHQCKHLHITAISQYCFYLVVSVFSVIHLLNLFVCLLFDLEQVILHAEYVLKLVNDDTKKISPGTILNGYIEFHNKTCLSLSCPLKKMRILHEMEAKQRIIN